MCQVVFPWKHRVGREQGWLVSLTTRDRKVRRSRDSRVKGMGGASEQICDMTVG